MASEDALPPPMQDAVPLDALPVQPSSTAAASSSRPNAHQQKYDRQLRLWAAAGQSALEHAHVLVINGNGTAASTLKNLVLPGPVSLSLPHLVPTHSTVSHRDDCTQASVTLLSSIPKSQTQPTSVPTFSSTRAASASLAPTKSSSSSSNSTRTSTARPSSSPSTRYRTSARTRSSSPSTSRTRTNSSASQTSRGKGTCP